MLGLVIVAVVTCLRFDGLIDRYGFKVHDWKLTPHQLDALLRSFDGISQFRESQVQRVLFRNGISGFRRRSDADVQRDRSEMATAARAKGLSPDPDEIETAVLKTEALAPNGESPPATISWAEFCQHMGRRIRDGDDAFSSENKARPLVLDFDVGAASGHAVAAGKPRSKAAGAFVLPANRPDEVLKELSAKSMKRMASFSHRHKSAVAHEFQSSKMSLRQWEQVALKAVVDKVYSQVRQEKSDTPPQVLLVARRFIAPWPHWMMTEYCRLQELSSAQCVGGSFEINSWRRIGQNGQFTSLLFTG